MILDLTDFEFDFLPDPLLLRSLLRWTLLYGFFNNPFRSRLLLVGKVTDDGLQLLDFPRRRLNYLIFSFYDFFAQHVQGFAGQFQKSLVRFGGRLCLFFHVDVLMTVI